MVILESYLYQNPIRISMKKLYYPAKFVKEEKGYFVQYLDFENVFTQGEDLEDAYYMAKDALFGMLDFIEEMPTPTFDYNKIKLNNGEFITLVELDVEEHAKLLSNKVVKTTVTMPEWLKRKGENNGVNFSQLLQEKLKEELNL